MCHILIRKYSKNSIIIFINIALHVASINGLVNTDVISKNLNFRGPKIIVEPEDVVFDLSGRTQSNQVKLRCVADAYPEPVYTWYREEQQSEGTVGIPIDPLEDEKWTQTDGTLTIYNPNQTNDKGKYYCAAQNEYGRVISQTVSITFGYILEFSKKRSFERGKENWGKSISCDAPQHHPRARFYWSKSEFSNFVQEDKRVFISQDGNLYFSALEKIDRSNYSCQLQSSISSTGRFGPSFALVVEPASNSQKLQFANGFPKVFPESPLAGQDVRLECMAYGYPTPSYNWTRVNNKLPRQHSIMNDGKVLFIPNIGIKDEGEYICRTTSETDTLQKSAMISVQASPNFTHPLQDITVGERETVVLLCEAFGLPSVSYAWFKNGDEIILSKLSPVDYQRYSLRDNKFIIDGVMKDRDSGIYQCRASNQHGTALSAAQLTIANIKPIQGKTVPSLNVIAMVDHNATIPCNIEAVPKPTIVWRKDGLLFDDRLRARKLANGSLQITKVRISDGGSYECSAENQFGSLNLKTWLTVKPAPVFSDAPLKKNLATFGDAFKIIHCEVQYDYPLEVSHVWLKNGLPIETSNTNQNQFEKYFKSDSGQLIIRNITYSDQANYTCKLKTSIGSVEQSGSLLVRGPPDACGLVSAENLTATSARISWTDGFDHYSRIWANTIEARTNHNQTWHVIAANISAQIVKSPGQQMGIFLLSRKSIIVSDILLPWSVYEFRVSSTNEFGEGQPSVASPKYRTEAAAPRFPVTNVRGGGGKAGTLSIKWDPLHTSAWGSNEMWYQVYYRASGMFEWTKRELVSAGGSTNAYTVNVGNDNYYRQFDVMIQPVNVIGAGPLSAVAKIYSAQQMPRIQPTNVYGVAHNSTALNVTWSPIDDIDESGKLIGYKIRYWPSGKDPQTHSLINLKRGTEPWGLVVGLQPETEYHVAVMAFNEAGSGPESESFRIRTFKAAPQRAPTSVNAEFIDGTTARVTWRGITSVTSNEEPVLGYKVRYWRHDEPISAARDIVLKLGGQLSAIVTDLIAGETYKLRVLAFSSGGDGKMSSPALILKPSI